jgi:hypothetical protein
MTHTIGTNLKNKKTQRGTNVDSLGSLLILMILEKNQGSLAKIYL